MRFPCTCCRQRPFAPPYPTTRVLVRRRRSSRTRAADAVTRHESHLNSRSHCLRTGCAMFQRRIVIEVRPSRPTYTKPDRTVIYQRINLRSDVDERRRITFHCSGVLAHIFFDIRLQEPPHPRPLHAFFSPSFVSTNVTRVLYSAVRTLSEF